MKTALICGISGQDGSYLARLLLGKGYTVYGASRDAQMGRFANLRTLELIDRVNLVSMNLNDFRSVLQILARVEPDEIYNLAGQTSVGLSFEQPVEAMESISVGTLNLLESIRFTGAPIRLYSAGSGECFGDTGNDAADEMTPFRPRSPYGVAKAAAYWQVAGYREAYGLHACTGIMFNHESPLRPPRFVTRKIVQAVSRIATGQQQSLSLGNIDIRRDWGWAPEYVEAMWMMLQRDEPQDFVIATGQNHSLRDFIEKAFALADLDWRKYVATDPALKRPLDLTSNRGNPSLANKRLGWHATSGMEEVVTKMLAAEQTL